MTAHIQIFNMAKVATLTLSGHTGATLMNYPVNRTDFSLVKGITNELLFFVKDTDRHPVTANSIANAGITAIRIVITNPANQTLLLGSQTVPVPSDDKSIMSPAQLSDPRITPEKGVWYLKLTNTDIADWPLGDLQYSVVCDRVGGDQVMLYTDRNYTPYSSMSVLPGPFPAPREAVTFTPADTLTIYSSLFSSEYPGAAAVGNLTGEHSAVVHLDEFEGSVTIQASLENEPPVTDSDWFAAEITNATQGEVQTGNGSVFFNTATTGPTYIGFNGNYMWVRFIVHTALLTDGVWTAIDYRAD